jgi:LacI family transcriptional regulator
MMGPGIPQGQDKLRRRRGAKPTVADVARLAGVSPMTVSRVTNAVAGVLPETRRKVEEAIAALGYVPNVAARALAGARQFRVAMLHSNPSAAYLSEFLVGSLAGAADNDAQLIIEHWDGSEGAEPLARRLEGHRIDAVVLPPPLCEDAPLLAALASRGLPTAQVATGSPAASCHAVSIDDVGAATAVTRHLIRLGHRRIGFIGGDPNQSASALRQRGYEDALREAGLPIDPALIATGDFTYRSGLAAAEALLTLPERPSAVFASNDDMAAAVVAVAHRHRLDLPGDISVCGFDDTAMATTIWPELTTVRQPIAGMARAAVALLAKALDSNASDAVRHRRLPFELVVRGSTAAPAD